jgi:cytoskeletal protein RodZ
VSTTPAPRARPLTIILISACGVLLLAVVALVFLFIGRASGGNDQLTNQALGTTSPTAAPAPSPTQAAPTTAPSAAPTKAPAPAPVDHSTRFTSFVAPTTVKCVQGSDTKPLIRVSWSSANAVSAWYTANGGDAANDKYMQIPLSGTQDNFTDEHLFDCFHRPSQDYTLTLVAPNGAHISKHWTVTNVGDQ